MRKIKEILRLRLGQGLPVRSIAQSLAISHSTVIDTVHRANAAGLRWPLPEDVDDAELEARLYPGNRGQKRVPPEPDWNYIHQELRRKGVTRQLLWLEYKQNHPDGYQYSRFCQRYRDWAKKVDVVMRQHHRAGEKMFVDFAGQTLPIVDSKTGETREAHLFVAVLGASNYTFADIAEAEDLENWVTMTCKALAFFGGTPEIVVPDNPKSVVLQASRYEPGLNPTYMEMAEHYGMAVVPARPAKPRDKAKAENGVLFAERWLLAPLRNRTFFSLAEARKAISELVGSLNERPFQKLEGCRRSLFETVEKPTLRTLPDVPYEFAQWKHARVNIDYHIEVEKSYYSVPYQLAQEEVDARYTATTVEVFYKGRRVASHVRNRKVGYYTTDPAHMPAAHRRYLEWKPSRIISWARNGIGPNTAELVEAIMKTKRHPEQGYRACLGVLRLAKYYETERIENASKRALACRALSYSSLKSILENGLDRQPLEEEATDERVSTHENVRGPHYYAKEGSSSSC